MSRLQPTNLSTSPLIPRSPEYFMRRALHQAALSERKGEAPIGAVIVYQGRIVAHGRNSRQNSNLITGHAEISAILQAERKLKSWRLPECDIYVTLEPCIMCAGAIQQARIRHVYFGASDPKGGAVVSCGNIFDLPGLNHHVGYTGAILADECSTALSNFFRNLRQAKSGKR